MLSQVKIKPIDFEKKLESNTQNPLEVHSAHTFVICCMDFRLCDDVTKFMKKKGQNKNYDQFVLAGASLGFTQKKYEYWRETLLDHLQMGLELHHVREIIFIDHIDCGAYKKFYPQVIGKHKKQFELHQKHMQKARDILAARYPNMTFQGYIMDLTGECARLKIKQDVKFDKKVAKKEDDQFLRTLKH